MINNIKNMIGKVMILVLMLMMVMPARVFAGTHTVNNWNEYKEKLIEDIMKQEEDIIINFNLSEIFTTEYFARLKITNAYEEAKERMPRIYGNLNIVSETTGLVLDGTSNAHLKSVTHKIGYKTHRDNFTEIRKILDNEYITIKTKVTDYEKIKASYDYVVGELKELGDVEGVPRIKELLSGQKKNAHTFLFAMVMTDLGYDNDIATATGEDGSKWNLVKIQGKWYHVNATEVDMFLISKNGDLDWDKDKHNGKVLADDDYKVSISPLVPQLKYEIELIINEIANTLREIRGISEEISMEEINETKKKFKTIDEKVKNYKEIKDILGAEVSKLEDKSLENEFIQLEKRINVIIPKDIKEKKSTIVNKAVANAEETLQMKDILAAKEAITMIDDKEPLEKKMNALELAILAIEKAEKTKLGEDIILAKAVVENLKTDQKLEQRLGERIKVLEATISVEKAENTRISADVDIASDLVKTIGNEEERAGLAKRVKIIEDEITAKKAVDKAEEVLQENEIIDKIEGEIVVAKLAIEKVMNDTIRKQLQDRIQYIETAVTSIKLIDAAEEVIATITTESSLKDIIETAKDNIKKADAGKIKDTVVKTKQQNRIKDINIVIAAITAVDKAETIKPPSSTNIKSARTAIDKIIKTEYNDIKVKLNSRITVIDESIKYVDAEKLIEKVEISLKRSDYDKAKLAVDKLEKANGKGLELENRRKDVETIILTKEAIENAEKLMKANKEKVEKYEELIDLANSTYNKVNIENERYEVVISDLGKRIEDMKTTIKAIKQVDTTEIIYQGYLNGINTESKLRELINKSEPLVLDISSNFSSIKKSLGSRLKIFSDRLNADVDYNVVSEELDKIEKSLIVDLEKKDKELDNAIESLRKQISSIEELSKKVKVSGQSKDLKDRTAAVNDVIDAFNAVVKAEVKDEKNVAKDIAAANKAVDKLSITGIHKSIKDIKDYKDNLKSRISKLENEVETSTNESKARSLVDKAISLKKESDIKLAIEAVSKLRDGVTKTTLNTKIEEDIVKQLIKDTNDIIITTILSIELNDKSVSKNVAEVKKASLLVGNVVLLADAKLQTTEGSSYKTKYEANTIDLNKNIKVIDISVEALGSVQQAEKSKKQEDVDKATSTMERISDNDLYTSMKSELNRRIEVIRKHITGESNIASTAETAVSTEEEKMTVTTNPIGADLRKAQDAVNKVNDKVKKVELQKRIDAMNTAITAKAAVERAEAYTETTSVKVAEKELDNLAKTGSYLEIIKDLSNRIAKLNNQLNISKLVTEATNLVQKAVTSRTSADSIKARFAVEGIKDLVLDPDNKEDPTNPYNSLKKMLDDLDTSIKDEAAGETNASEDAKKALIEALKLIDEVNIKITGIKEGDSEVSDIKEAYGMIQAAKNQIIIANAAVKRLSGPNKGLLSEIDFANKEIDLSEDNIDVKEAVRLVTIASSSVMNATTEGAKSKARLDIAAARRAIDKIGHNDNKAIKTTILNTINSIEKKLTTDNDQELIDLAVEAVNSAAEILASAVKENKVLEKREQIDKAIFAARMAIGWISDNNKAAKATLTGFINDIAAIFEAEKDGILNEDRIKNAEKAVVEAESKKGSDQLESYIRSARLKVKIINNDSPETAVIINDLNTRLDALEGKGGGNSGGNNSNKPGGGSGSNKPGSDTSTGNKVPTSPLPDKDRFIGNTAPIWGKTNELNKKNPVTDLSNKGISVFWLMESKMKIVELSKILKTMQIANVKLVVGGKNINADSKTYIHDKSNNSILVPAKFLGDELGFSVSLIDSPITKGAKRLLLIGMVDGKPKSIIMDLGSEFCYVNGNLVRISSKPVINGGRTYIPIDLMVEHFGLTFSYYIQGNNIQLIIN